MVGVLFICMGNICRSPLAEVLFRAKVEAAGLAHQFEIDSAGTGSWHEGERADSRSIAVAARHGLEIPGRARQIRPRDVRTFRYLVVMDVLNYAAVQQLRQTRETDSELLMIRTFDPRQDGDEVPDPYSLSDDAFDEVYAILDRSTAGLLAYIRDQHRL
ncbi:MAG: low molecular weight protein-tyrosine-phosphatase [Sphingobacteriia bacterium]|jgi:protein-tyrosine phosphatase